MTAKSAILKNGDLSNNLAIGKKPSDISEDSYYEDANEDYDGSDYGLRWGKAASKHLMWNFNSLKNAHSYSRVSK